MARRFKIFRGREFGNNDATVNSTHFPVETYYFRIAYGGARGENHQSKRPNPNQQRSLEGFT